jgi:hypothetical protein
MRLIQVVEHLDSNKELKYALLRSGALSSNLFTQAEIYKYYMERVAELRKSKTKSYKGVAISQTVAKFKISKSSTYLAIQHFSK